MRNFIILLFTLCLAGCSGETPQNLPQRVDELIAEDNYSQALELLQNADSTKTEADISKLKEKTYLNYGLFLEYRGPEDSSMRDRMTTALEQYIEVLKINPKNQKARAEIKQIMGIYKTMPNRSPGEDIIAELNKLGFDY